MGAVANGSARLQSRPPRARVPVLSPATAQPPCQLRRAHGRIAQGRTVRWAACNFPSLFYSGQTSPTPARGVHRLAGRRHAGNLSGLATCNAARSSTGTGFAGIANLPASSTWAYFRAAPFYGVQKLRPALFPPCYLQARPPFSSARCGCPGLRVNAPSLVES